MQKYRLILLLLSVMLLSCDKERTHESIEMKKGYHISLVNLTNGHDIWIEYGNQRYRVAYTGRCDIPKDAWAWSINPIVLGEELSLNYKYDTVWIIPEDNTNHRVAHIRAKESFNPSYHNLMNIYSYWPEYNESDECSYYTYTFSEYDIMLPNDTITPQ